MTADEIKELVSLVVYGVLIAMVLYGVFRFFVGYPPAETSCDCTSTTAPKRPSREKLAARAAAAGITVRGTDKRSDLERKLHLYADRVAALDVPEPVAAVSGAPTLKKEPQPHG